MAEQARDADPLVQRADALMRRHQAAAANSDADVPVLTDIVDETEAAAGHAPDQAALEALAHELERAVLERLGPQLERLTDQALERMRAQLAANVTQLVREAVSAAVARTVNRQARE
jgi:hypothetical protein